MTTASLVFMLYVLIKADNHNNYLPLQKRYRAELTGKDHHRTPCELSAATGRFTISYPDLMP